jgi:hypothetical protein
MSRLHSLLALATIFVLIPASAAAQNMCYGTAWIHRDAPMGTMIHAPGDTLCIAGFPASCYGGGMMRPDSLLCTWWTTPPDSAPAPMPLYCGVAVRCEVVGNGGQMMMSGQMTSPGLFGMPISVAIHYDPEVMVARGMDLAKLVLTSWINGRPTILTSATHDRNSALFTLSTTQLAEWYGVSDSTSVATPVTIGTWGQVKAKYRR